MTFPSILLVDDNEDMRQTIKAGLERDGYVVKAVANGREMLESLQSDQPDAVLLDLILPDGNGLDLMKEIRKRTSACVIVVSGKNDTVDKIVGLEMGADDYLGKPFQMKELSVRIKAQLRRTQTLSAPPSAPVDGLRQAEKIGFGKWILDRSRLQVFDQNGTSAGLTVKEVRLLETLILSSNRVLSREQLLDLSRNQEFNVTDRAIDTQITRIRKKLEDENSEIIEAIRGAGYIFIAKPVALTTD